LPIPHTLLSLCHLPILPPSFFRFLCLGHLDTSHSFTSSRQFIIGSPPDIHHEVNHLAPPSSFHALQRLTKQTCARHQ
jgi:hypothetical protein